MHDLSDAELHDGDNPEPLANRVETEVTLRIRVTGPQGKTPGAQRISDVVYEELYDYLDLSEEPEDDPEHTLCVEQVDSDD